MILSSLGFTVSLGTLECIARLPLPLTHSLTLPLQGDESLRVVECCITPLLVHLGGFRHLLAALALALTRTLTRMFTLCPARSITASLPHSFTALLYHWVTPSLRYCLTALLYHCVVATLLMQ